MRPLLMLRARGLQGPVFTKTANLARSLAHSAGNYIGLTTSKPPPETMAMSLDEDDTPNPVVDKE